MSAHPMPPPRVTSEDLSAWRLQLYNGQQLDAAAARRLMDEVERLREELAGARVTFARRASEALRKRLEDVATFNHGGCPACHDGEAKAFLVKLQRIASEKNAAPAEMPAGGTTLDGSSRHR